MEDYGNDYPINNDEISFTHFINRMSFWMATGSGKTLVIIKLIEIIGNLVSGEKIPEHDILFLAHRQNLIRQFEILVNEFNQHSPVKIKLINLKEYDRVKRENSNLFSGDEIKVFYYRSDLISDERKENMIDFRDYDNRGNWFIFLDEAHRGRNGDSKRQIFYSILSRNAFLFNFSATFTEDHDRSTCAFNFNLEKFIDAGYGKRIYLSENSIEGFDEETDFSDIEKQKVVLKALILQTYISSHYKKVSAVGAGYYHKPMLLTLVNSVNPKSKKPDAKQEPDLALFFKEIEKIAGNKIKDNLFELAKEELTDEMRDAKYFFGKEEIEISESELPQIGYENVLEDVFNTGIPGKLEVLKIPGNQQEIAFKLHTSEKPFALIKIGDISGWIKSILENKEITERYDDESIFGALNNRESDINILMGSRTFYEGWDSNRPNIILFVNIGKGKDSKKFVLQSIGRGVRIEPMENKRKRLSSLHDSKEVKTELYDELKENTPMLESLFIFGTNAQNLKSVTEHMKGEAEYKPLGDLFILNQESETRKLLIPVYEKSSELLIETKKMSKYPISRQDLTSSEHFLNDVGDKVALMKYDCEPRILYKIHETLNKPKDHYDHAEARVLNNPQRSLERMMHYFALESDEFKEFKKLDKEIIHFKKIQFRGNPGDYTTLKEKIGVIKNYPQKSSELDDLLERVGRQEYDKQRDLWHDAGSFSINNNEVNIKYLADHYYHPLFVSEGDKIDYLTHIINVPSEKQFIECLEENINHFSECDWWMFSKLDEALDAVYIPYYNANINKIAKFNPDFIFWLKKDNKYSICFIDPKGMAYADYQRKADGYQSFFGMPGKEKTFHGHGLEDIKVYLRFWGGDRMQVAAGYRDYWIDSITDIPLPGIR